MIEREKAPEIAAREVEGSSNPFRGTFSHYQESILYGNRSYVIISSPSVWQAKGFNFRVESLCYLVSTTVGNAHFSNATSTKFTINGEILGPFLINQIDEALPVPSFIPRDEFFGEQLPETFT